MKTLADVLVLSFEAEITSATEFLVGGGVKSFDDYKEVVGRIRGLQLAIHTTKDLARNQMDSDDD